MNWSITKLIVKPKLGHHENAVAYVAWKAAKGVAEKFGTIALKEPGDGFVPYAQLTEAQVLSWVWANIDKNEIEAQLAEPSIAILGDTAVLPLPWA